MKIRLLSFGKNKSGLFSEAVEEYAKRLSRYVSFEMLELPASRQQGALAKREEATWALKQLKAKELLWALDERGWQCTSVELSRQLERQQIHAHNLCLVIGGDEGLDASLLQRAHLVLALGRITLPHRMARLVLVEQLYRSFCILKAEPYHK
ncbi:MAG: 23S rRNA (pseudouridine(1915)-N(3))-methyltransferase RlmH [Cystobacterineae bacterium]|nr:23S rRNA (pseudouridine(1915)-N(3))-methyltransferase RlmH [Cystobacterineae bacterium]